LQLGLGNVDGSALGERGLRKRLEALASLDSMKGERLLDIGCASGAYTMALAEGFTRTDAIDVEPERLVMFRERLAECVVGDRIDIARMSGEAIGFGSETFDVVTAIETLEHIPNLERALEEIRRVLRPSGRFLVTGPNRYFPFESHGWLWRGRRHSPTSFPLLPWLRPLHKHLADARSFTVSSLRRQVESHGFRMAGYTYLMPAFDRKLRTLRWMDSLERTPLRFFGLTLVIAFDRAP
jgi:ubiquinone/menaquinone biosynthesis C-methylase UbiE